MIQTKTTARHTHLLAALAAGAAALLPPMVGRASDIPVGQLPAVAKPTAYRLDLTADPAQDGFHGHDEIDIQLAAPTRSLFLNGRDLRVRLAAVRVGGAVVAATYTQVDPSGVVRVDFAREIPAGRATLVFDYDGSFQKTSSGLFHVKVGDDWYAWTHLEPNDARRVFPSFDEPRFKAPLTLSIKTPKGDLAIGNAAEASTTEGPDGVVHRFAPTAPLATYLTAINVGPFVVAEGVAPPTPQRKTPLPLRIIATKPQAAKLQVALKATPAIVALLEAYFDRPFPFSKLDQIATPILPGGMENAGADLYGDFFLLLDDNAPTQQKQYFAEVVSHELSHQWFGDLVTPAWWDDLWLNESFANWMGFRIADTWRPDLKVGQNGVQEGLSAMSSDALSIGRPIHQQIARADQAESAFDDITYGKGGQVIAMTAAYMGDEKFRAGVRRYMNRFAYGTATSQDFFQALAEADQDPRILAAIRSFVDQQGAPLVSFRRDGDGYVATQSRYTLLGVKAPATRWTIPLCVRAGTERRCVLMDKDTVRVPISTTAPLMPNAGATGYYRFDLPPADWDRLVSASADLSAPEALAVEDSLWGSFAAGHAAPPQLLHAAQALADNPDAKVAVDGGHRLAGWRAHGLIAEAALPAYRAFVARTYGPRLATLGFDPTAGAYKADTADHRQLRGALVSLLANEGRDPTVRQKLDAAATAYLAGDAKAVDPEFLTAALTVHVETGGQAAAADLLARLGASQDPLFRDAALNAIGDGTAPDALPWLLGALNGSGLEAIERNEVIAGVLGRPDTSDKTLALLAAQPDGLFAALQGLSPDLMINMYGRACSTQAIDLLTKDLQPKVDATGVGKLTLARVLERIHGCTALKQARSDEIAQALQASLPTPP
jgi:aminopeptidase N